MSDGSRAPAGDGPIRRAYPFVVLLGTATFPFLGFAYENRNEPIDVTRLAVYGAVVWLVALGAWWVLVRARRLDPDRAALAVAAVVFSFFASSWWLEPGAVPGEPLLPFVLWLVVTGAATVLLYRIGRSEAVRTFLLFTTALLPIVPLAGLVLDAVQSPPPSTVGATDDGVALDLDEDDPRPNIYHFVLDFHGRADQVEQFTGHDIEPFLGELEDRGFDVARDALASYPITALSLSSTFDMGYVATEPDDVDDGLDPYFDLVRGDSRAIEALREAGYTFVYSPNGTFNGFDCSTDLADECIAPTSSGLAVSELDYQLIEATPLGLFDLAQTPFTDPTYVVDEVQEVDPPEPFVLLAHVISPHPPYRFRDDCTRRDEPRVREQDKPEQERSDYATDVRCIDDDLLRAVDQILADDPGAVIIVQSDHGSEFLTPWYMPYDEWSDEALLERYAVLNAVKLPDECEHDLADDEALVNTYRLLFACLGGVPEVDRLPFEAFLFRWGDENDLVPIETDRLTGDPST